MREHLPPLPKLFYLIHFFLSVILIQRSNIKARITKIIDVDVVLFVVVVVVVVIA